MSKVRSGGYQSGLTYSQYRSYGHGKVGAFFMVLLGYVDVILLPVLGILVGLVLANLLWMLMH